MDCAKDAEVKTFPKLAIYFIMLAQVILDIALINAAAVLALMLRFDFNVPAGQLHNYYRAAGITSLIMVVSFYIFNLYSSIWRYASVGELLHIFFSGLVGSSALFVLFRHIWLINFLRDFYLMFWRQFVTFNELFDNKLTTVER